MSLLRRRPIGPGGDDLRLAGRRRGRSSDGAQTRHDIPEVCRGVDQTRFHSATDGTVRRYGMVAASGTAGKQSGILSGSALSGIIRAHEAEEDSARMIELYRRRRGQPAGRESRRGMKMRSLICFFFLFYTDLVRAHRIK